MVIFSCSLENVIPTCEFKPAVEQVCTTVLYHSNIIIINIMWGFPLQRYQLLFSAQGLWNLNLWHLLVHFQDTHRLYKQKLEEVTKLQNSCTSAISRQRKILKELTVSLRE